MTRPLICLVTSGRLTSAGALSSVAARAVSAGIDLLQVRERALNDRELLASLRLAAAVPGAASRLVVNDRLDLALAAGAAGVHLPGASVPPSIVRTITPADFLVGTSVHSVDEARRIEGAGGCDYLIFGTVFPSASKPGTPAAGVAALGEVCRAVALPVLAIGGITVANAREAAAAGAAGVAAISLFEGPDDLGPMVRQLRQAFDN